MTKASNKWVHPLTACSYLTVITPVVVSTWTKITKNNRTGRTVLLDELSRELDRDETALHELELERIDEVDRQRRAVRDRAGEGIISSSSSSSSPFVAKS